MYKATVSQENVFFISDKIVGDNIEEIKEIVELGIKSIIIFGVPEKKDETHMKNPTNPVPGKGFCFPVQHQRSGNHQKNRYGQFAENGNCQIEPEAEGVWIVI